MKEYFKLSIVKIGVISIIFFVIIECNNDYMEFKNKNCIVLDKMIVGGRRSDNLYLILKEENGIIFDRIVSPATFYMSKIGDEKTFSLRSHDIRQTCFDNVLYFFIPVFIMAIAISCFAIGFILLNKT